jgi:hypothetical protein
MPAAAFSGANASPTQAESCSRVAVRGPLATLGRLRAALRLHAAARATTAHLTPLPGAYTGRHAASGIATSAASAHRTPTSQELRPQGPKPDVTISTPPASSTAACSLALQTPLVMLTTKPPSSVPPDKAPSEAAAMRRWVPTVPSCSGSADTGQMSSSEGLPCLSLSVGCSWHCAVVAAVRTIV